MYSTSASQSIDGNEETTKVNVYDDNGYLPIHRAAISGHESTIRNILDDAQRRNELTQQLEAITHNVNEFTPLLLATAVGRLESIACLLKYPVNFNAVDANGHGNRFCKSLRDNHFDSLGLAAVAALSQNERTLRYIIDSPIPSYEYNVWKPLLKLFLSIKDEESLACARMFELLTRRQTFNSPLSPYWYSMIEHGLLPAIIQIFTLSKNDDLILSTLLLLFNLTNELPEMKSEFQNNKNAFSSMLKHTNSTNQQILALLGRVLANLSMDKSSIDSMVEQGVVDALMILIEKHRSPQIISPYFDCLSNVVSNSLECQQKLALSKDFLLLITRVYLEEYDLHLSLSVIRFIRQLSKNNEEIQNTLAQNGACEHLLGALLASSKELQQVAIEAIQSLSHNNLYVQQILLNEQAIEQLLTLLEKTNLSNLQIAIVCTLWTLCENHSSRKREVATRIGVRKLISFYTLKSEEHILAVTDSLNELSKGPASVKMNIPKEINQAQGIPYLIRLLKSHDEALVLSVLKTLQLITCASGFIANRTNQEVIVKNDGITLLVALMMHAKSEIVQVESAQALACIALTNSHCLKLIESTLDFSYSHLFHLMQSTNVHVQIQASNALSTFIYNNSRIHLSLSQQYELTFEYFEKFFNMNNDFIRCIAAFQIVVLANFIHEQRQSMSTAIGCGILIDILRLSQIDQAKSTAAECLARLAHMKSGVPQALVAVNAINYLCNLYTSSNDITIGNASIALGFLSYLPEGQRKLFNRCRTEPDIMSFLKVYNCLPNTPSHLSPRLIEDWDRYSAMLLPRLSTSTANLRYFRVLANHVERSRLAPSAASHEKDSNSSTILKFYLPPIRQKV